MNVMVLSINYAPEQTGFGPHVAALCEHLASRDHAVTAITGFPFAPYWARWPGYRGRLIADERINGVRVIRVTHFIPRRPGRLLQRLLMEGSFGLASAWAALTRSQARWDVILYVGAQPGIAMVARYLAGLYRIPYVVNVQDLAAQAAAGVGIVKVPWATRMLDRLEFWAYRRAGGAMVLCDAFQQALIAHGYPAKRIRIIRSPVDVERIRPVLPDPVFRQTQHLAPGDFVVLYAGSMGLKQGLTNVIEAARLLGDDGPSVRWVLVGEGELRSALQEQVARHGLAKQVRLLPLQPAAEMSAMFSSADLLLLNQRGTVKDTVIPSKLLTYMAAGRAVLAAVNPSSQAAALLCEAQGGLVTRPEDPAALASAVRQLQAEPAALQEMGQRNRRYAEQHFDQRRIVAAQEAFLVEVVSRARQEAA